MFLSADRFVAIRWPMWHRHRQTSTVLWTLLGIWLVTILGSAVTGAIPQYFNYMYNPQVFMFTLGYAGSNVESRAHGLLHFGLALFLPYVVTIILTMLTGAAAFRGLKSFSTMNESQRPSISENGRTELPHVKYAAGFIRPKKGLMRQDTIRITGDTKKPEFAVVQTIIIMVVAFALAWSLFFVIFFISYNNEPKNERATSVVYMVSFYSGLSNSVANVVIYSVRDDRFRSAVASTFRHKNMSSYHNSSYGSK
uniref:uncharacterized protein LOC120346065 n=1 Tax=Styela clava TaxID=7725 RepID=UPI00193A8D41|nr:uncharacterized protein LOC120346065 [Styela clava]